MKQIKPNTLFFKKIKKNDLLIYLLSLLTPMHKLHKIDLLMIILN